MQLISYYIALPFIYFISYLPFPILYIVSDFCYFLLYKVVGYRKNVVRLNLQRSFPELSIEEVIRYEKQFFRNLTDIMLETIKCFTISREEVQKHVKLRNPESLKGINNRNFIATAGHLGNFEMLARYLGTVNNTSIFPFSVKAVYKPLSNPYFEKFFFKSRSKYGPIMYPIKKSKEAFEMQNENAPFAFFLINDQSAPPEKSYITTFLNQETAFFKGPETYSKLHEMPVFYVHIEKPARGKYEIEFREITTKPNQEPENFILEQHARLLEKDIEKNIPNWLWSHKRWKFKKVDGKYVDVNYKK